LPPPFWASAWAGGQALASHHIALRPSGPILVQYWRSTEQLQRSARDSLLPHLAAWRMFNRWVGFTGDVGFWHETYVVQPGQYETVYGNMPHCARPPTRQPARQGDGRTA
jgi:hypothetical protein